MQTVVQTIWETAQQHLRSRLGADTYPLWFAPLHARPQGEGLVLDVPDDFCEVWVKENYIDLLKEVVALAAGRELKIEFEVRANTTTPRPASREARSSSGTVPEPM